ncbi:hypothetical protein H1230_16570 [Paenibacillus sp. 19GGS1-52]|uniref:hypothetical protein n=1 Tax=Paenibacillus sp. 19GGS1-52 TaxID=2758563 RepID=UPI001EFAEC4E|nr:hypothetical protein [Paenibacillus sp. 19GGS1-52]ULO04773.1 hypothetical protein H1230_16570 [Paenibacillus sp. 19GGS1-52]
MWWRRIILIWVLGLASFTGMNCTEAYSQESPTKYNDDIQRKCLEEVLIFELRPKFMSVLGKEYDNFLFGSPRIIPIKKSDSYPQQEFILEGRVTKQDSISDVVQITFKASTDGYKAINFHIIRNEKSDETMNLDLFNLSVNDINSAEIKWLVNNRIMLKKNEIYTLVSLLKGVQKDNITQYKGPAPKGGPARIIIHLKSNKKISLVLNRDSFLLEGRQVYLPELNEFIFTRIN